MRVPHTILYHEPDSLKSPVPVREVNISQTSGQAAAGHSWLLRAKVEPSATWSRRVVWSSDNPRVATVEANGYVTAHAEGKANIVAASSDGSKSATCAVTVAPATISGPWQLRNIGPMNLFGSAAAKDGEFTITGGGGDIGSTSDEFAFLSRTVNGNASLVARITSQTNTHEWAKAGLMFREGRTGSNKFVMLGVTPEQGLTFLFRKQEGSWCDGTGLGDLGKFSFPVYLKLEKEGNTFRAYKSSDGVNWTFLTRFEAPEPFKITQAGLVVNSHRGDELGTVKFDHVNLAVGAGNNRR